MDFSEIVAVVAGIGSVLALVASVFSAAGAAKSADVAVMAEGRIKEAERGTALRELTRQRAQLEVETRITVGLLEDAALFSAGGPESQVIQRQKAFVEGLGGHLAELHALSSLTDDQMTEWLLLLDEVLVKLRAEKELAIRRFNYQHVERAIAAMRRPVR